MSASASLDAQRKPLLLFSSHAAWLVALAAPLILYRLGSYSLVNGDEAIYQGIAESMVESGNWFRLEFVGAHRVYDTFMNAPLQYWARALLIELFGSNLWTTRTVSALFGVATVLATWRLAREIVAPAVALLAGVVLLTTYQFVYIHGARTGELDTAVAFFITLAALLFLRRVDSDDASGRWPFIGHHLCLIALLNLKLPVAAIPVLAELVCFALVPRFRRHFRAWAVSGFLLVPWGLAWHGYQLFLFRDSAGEILGQIFGQASGSIPMGARSGFWINVAYYGETIGFGAFPYSLAYLVALPATLAAATGRERERWIALVLFPAVLLGFYLNLALHLRQYVLPAYPFLSIFVAAWLARLARGRAGPAVVAACALVASGVLWIAIDWTGLNPFAQQANLIDMELGWRRAAALSPPVGVLATALLVGAGLQLARVRWPDRAGPIVALAIGALLLGMAGLRSALPLRDLGHQSELAQVRARIDRVRAAGGEIELPIAISERGFWRARYYFAREFAVRRHTRKRPLPEGVEILLLPKRERSGLASP